jgi:hypothetical protein
MPVVSEVPRPHGFKEVTFQLTPPMSTYLLAFVVADFPHVVRSEPGKIPVKVYARSDVVTQGQYAADITFRLVEAFGGMYAASYALPKLDLVAVPDFAAGAMENWGLMTFREVTLLYDPASSSTWSKQLSQTRKRGVIVFDDFFFRVVAKVVAHEIAHQWFGDLVTMQWWNEVKTKTKTFFFCTILRCNFVFLFIVVFWQVWLNEGFAEFVEYLGVEMVEPSWQVWDHFLADDLSRALELDALPSAPPLVMHEDAVETDDQIDSRFSGISYSKGTNESIGGLFESIVLQRRLTVAHAAPVHRLCRARFVSVRHAGLHQSPPLRQRELRPVLRRSRSGQRRGRGQSHELVDLSSGISRSRATKVVLFLFHSFFFWCERIR